jgi:uncharacterized membrane protein
VAEPGDRWQPPDWAWPATAAMSLVGLGISIYLTAVHYSSSVTLACTSSGTINCEKVTSSPQSMLLGRPVALWGAVYFVLVTAVCLPWAWRSPSRELRLVRIALVVAGILFALRLVYAELFEIDAICLWCTAVHIDTLALFAAVLVATAAAGSTAARR